MEQDSEEKAIEGQQDQDESLFRRALEKVGVSNPGQPHRPPVRAEEPRPLPATPGPLMPEPDSDPGMPEPMTPEPTPIRPPAPILPTDPDSRLGQGRPVGVVTPLAPLQTPTVENEPLGQEGGRF